MTTPAPRGRRKWVRRLALLFVLAVGVWLLSALAVAYRLTRRAQPMRPEPVPAVGWATFQPIRLTTADGQGLGAWFVPGRPDRPAVVLLHGNGGSRGSCLDMAELLAPEGHALLLVTLRAHGDSTGEVNDFGFSARHDVTAAVGCLEANAAGRPVVVWGRSLGAAAAVFAAGNLGGRVKGYLLECPYRDLRSAVRNRTRMYLPPVVDAVAHAGLTITAPLVLPDIDRISLVEAAGRVPREMPVRILAGGQDRRATPADARAVLSQLGPAADLIVIEGGDHLALDLADPVRYRAAVREFLARCR